MSALDDFARRVAAAPATPLAGVVDAAPGSPIDPVIVLIDADRRRTPREAFGWAPHGDNVPAAGCRIAVVRADDGELWVVGWQGA